MNFEQFKNLRSFKISKVISILALLGSADAVVIRHDVGVGAYQDLAEQAPFEGLVKIQVGCCFSARYGSGFLIGDGWLLTAAHVLWGAAPSKLQVEWGGVSYGASAIHYAPGWGAAPQIGLDQGADLALVQLNQRVQASAPTRLSNGNSLGQMAVILGTGRTGNGIVGANLSPMTLGAMNYIDRQLVVAGGGVLVSDFDDGSSARSSLNAATVSRAYYDIGFTDPLLSEAVLDAAPETSVASFDGLPGAADFFPGLSNEFLEGTTASGDSGGPLMVWNPDSQDWELAGITSWGVNPLLSNDFARSDSRYGDLSLFTDVSQHRDWIAATVPELSLTHLLIVGALVSLWRRRF